VWTSAPISSNFVIFRGFAPCPLIRSFDEGLNWGEKPQDLRRGSRYTAHAKVTVRGSCIFTRLTPLLAFEQFRQLTFPATNFLLGNFFVKMFAYSSTVQLCDARGIHCPLYSSWWINIWWVTSPASATLIISSGLDMSGMSANNGITNVFI